MLSNQNEKVLKTLFNIELISNNENSKQDTKKDNRKIVSKKLEEMKSAHVVLEKNTNNVMVLRYRQ